ncbi:hypothetical protein Scep_007900 [Stephania cephalantha]|uniref:S-protein homolog n=1 Tax=Stephania cephalantha TaxID=152367 RepID=A0AAP0KAP8_9MAGN
MASSNYSFTVLAFLIVLASISIDSTASSLIGKKKHVHVVNNIKSASNRIYVHCKSRDNDLGDQYLPLNKEFQWSFRDNIMGTTLFFCTINWKNVHDKRRYGLVYDSYVALKTKCDTDCIWSARSDGVYFYEEDSKSYVFKYYWNVIPPKQQ